MRSIRSHLLAWVLLPLVSAVALDAAITRDNALTIATVVQDRLLVLFPQAWSEYRDRGMAQIHAGNTRQAVQDLETYLKHAQDGLDIDAVAAQVNELRRASN